jgi:hypothetical protein
MNVNVRDEVHRAQLDDIQVSATNNRCIIAERRIVHYHLIAPGTDQWVAEIDEK